VNGIKTYLVKEVYEIGLRRSTLLRLPRISEIVVKVCGSKCFGYVAVIHVDYPMAS
jgi:hypothetical protein